MVYRWLIEVHGGSARKHEYRLLVLCPSVTLKHLELQTTNCEPPFDIYALVGRFFSYHDNCMESICVLLNQNKIETKISKRPHRQLIPTFLVSLTGSQISLYSPKEFTFKSKYRFWYLVVKLLLNWKWLFNLQAFVIFSLAINLNNIRLVPRSNATNDRLFGEFGSYTFKGRRLQVTKVASALTPRIVITSKPYSTYLISILMTNISLFKLFQVVNLVCYDN